MDKHTQRIEIFYSTLLRVENKDCVLAAKELIDAGYNPAMLNWPTSTATRSSLLNCSMNCPRTHQRKTRKIRARTATSCGKASSIT